MAIDRFESAQTQAELGGVLDWTLLTPTNLIVPDYNHATNYDISQDWKELLVCVGHDNNSHLQVYGSMSVVMPNKAAGRVTHIIPVYAAALDGIVVAYVVAGSTTGKNAVRYYYNSWSSSMQPALCIYAR